MEQDVRVTRDLDGALSGDSLPAVDRRDRDDLRRMLALVRRRWRPLALATTLLAGSSLLGLALPLVVRSLVDSVLVSGNLARLNALALGLVALFAFQSLLSAGHTYLLIRIAQEIGVDLRLQLYERLQRLPLGFFSRRRTGELVSRVTNDVTVVQDTLTQTPTSFLRQLITLVGGLTIMVVMNWQLTLLILVVVPPIALAAAFFGRRLQGLSTDVQDRLADSIVTLEEMLSGIRIVKSFAREPWERARFARAVEASLVAALRRARLQAVFTPTVSLLGSGALTLLLWYGGRQVVRGTLTPGELIALLVLMMMIAMPLGDLAGLYGRLRQGLGAAHRVFRLLDVAPEPLDVPGALPPGRLRGRVRFTGVSFAYDGVHPVLDAVSLDVAPGEVVALVGPSGAGKTTLVNLIPRFYDPASGRVEIDGLDLRRLDLRALREQIGIVPQETFLFGGTVRENIAYGRPDATDDEIRAAARAANAEEFIRRLPEGYETVVGEKGVRLSAGQRQRLAIARVLLKDPRLLILDEATSSLDTASERLVQEALERIMADRTTVVIAHRLSTVRRADRILVLDGGRIVEEGTHPELLALGGLYQRLWSLQFTESDDPAPII